MRPRGAKEFQRLLQRHATQAGHVPQRVMHLVRVGVVCAFLDEVRHDDDGGHLFVVKGGTALQLRLGIEARATTDLDVAFRGAAQEWLDRFDQATVDRTWHGFTVTRKGPPAPIDVPGVHYQPWRVGLQLRYEGRDFGSTHLEVAIEPTGTPYDLVEPAGIVLDAFDIEPPRLVPCLDLPTQIAQKLHACTEPGNDRARDVIDLWLLDRLLTPGDLPAIRGAVIETFTRRGTHRWPPAVVPSSSWERDYPLLAGDHTGAPASLDEAVAFLHDLVSRLDVQE